jgi:hypothetical protein
MKLNLPVQIIIMLCVLHGKHDKGLINVVSPNLITQPFFSFLIEHPLFLILNESSKLNGRMYKLGEHICRQICSPNLYIRPK